MIDEKVLIGRLEEESYQETVDDLDPFGDISRMVISLNKAKEIVKELAEEYKGGWIPCSEKYPEDNQTVLTIDSEGNMEVLDYDTNWENSFCKYGGTVKVFNIIAWQPLPEAYNTEGE